jgi:hypothetical protein
MHSGLHKKKSPLILTKQGLKSKRLHSIGFAGIAANDAGFRNFAH